jgi:hypothetical protein
MVTSNVLVEGCDGGRCKEGAEVGKGPPLDGTDCWFGVRGMVAFAMKGEESVDGGADCSAGSE